jgi:microcystin degradation protein MlrC
VRSVTATGITGRDSIHEADTTGLGKRIERRMGAKLQASATLAVDGMRRVAQTVQNDEHEFARLHSERTLKKLHGYPGFNVIAEFLSVVLDWRFGRFAQISEAKMPKGLLVFDT